MMGESTYLLPLLSVHIKIRISRINLSSQNLQACEILPLCRSLLSTCIL